MQKGQMSWSKSATSCLVTPMHPKKPPITLVALDHQPDVIRTTAETMLSRPAAGMLWHSLRTSCLRTSQGTTKSRSLLPRLSPEDFVVIQEKQVPVDVKILYYRIGEEQLPLLRRLLPLQPSEKEDQIDI